MALRRGILLFLLCGKAIASESLWYCNELESAGLRFQYGLWSQKSFNIAGYAIRQTGFDLDLEKLGMLADTTQCSFDYRDSIISCTDRYTLFNLNTRTGKAAMAHALGWVSETQALSYATNDLSVSALLCKKIVPAANGSPPSARR
jgi:hypothetical protein